MSKIQQEVALKEKYRSDNIMSRLLECDHDTQCINHALKYFSSSDLTLEEIGLVHHKP